MRFLASQNLIKTGLLLLILMGGTRAWGSPSSPSFEFERMEGDRLFFTAKSSRQKKTRSLRVPLENFQYIGLIKGEGHTYALVTGRACRGEKCLQEKAVYAYRMDGLEATHFVFPGKIIDPKKQQAVYDSRAFYGKCLPLTYSSGDVFTIFQKERIDKKNKLLSSVFIAQPGQDHLDERLIEKRKLPQLNDTLKRVKNKECFEISGMNRHILAKPLDLRPRRGQEDLLPDMSPDISNDDGGNEETKENQTAEELPSSVE